MAGEQGSCHHVIRFHPAIRAVLDVSECLLVFPSTPRSERRLFVESITVTGSVRSLTVHINQQHRKDAETLFDT